ncbi:cytochrome P450 [Aspergillus keveii]|uniref:Cytochrome P450 n=1 Tax=Aspergillus keveii TaxID=714993 RepID=A0ABR4FX15_9EURO
MDHFSLVWSVAVFLFIILVVQSVMAGCRPRNFPPGPRVLPVVGNMHQLPRRKTFLKHHDWTKKYGSIIGLKLGPAYVVILNSYKHVTELFDKKGSIYSSRPDNYVGGDLICPNDVHILLAQHGPGWRVLRKAVQALLNVNAVDALFPIQNAEATQTLCQLLDDPASYYDHIRRYSTAVILASVFGQRGAEFTSPKVQALYHAQDRFTAILDPGAAPPVDAFPFLKLIPEFLAPWKKEAREIRQEQRALYFELMRETKERISHQKTTGCFMERLLRDQEKLGLDDEHMVYLGGILMEAGSDTTASTLLSFILALTMHPEVLKKAQSEVDSVCGSERSPTFADIENLKYLKCWMDETLRWRPVAPGGIPHTLTEDDHYEGYFLPKGTILFANAWAIHNDENEYYSPEKFIPERFVDNKFGCRPEVVDNLEHHRRVTYGFGAGRRVCPGQRLAENSLMLNMAKLVWLFNILPGSEGGGDLSVETGYTDGFLIAPKKFPVRFVPRSDSHVETIQKELQQCQALFSRYE